MKKLLVLFAVTLCFSAAQAQRSSLHGFSVKTIKDSVISMKKYYGKKLMLVNTASFCSYTPQYEKLEQLYQANKHKNFEIIGFPSNDFGAQDPHSDSVIDVFCTENYSVTFQMMSKVEIVVGDTAPIYKWLQLKTLNEVKNVNVDWNFNKFLINESTVYRWKVGDR
jgi:glutathione peroxidase